MSSRPPYKYHTSDLYSAHLPAGFVDLRGNGDRKAAAAAHYADVSEIIPPTSPPVGAWDRFAWESTDNRWAGATFSAAREMLRDGWIEGADRAAAIRGRIEADRPAAQKLIRWDVAGAYPSVGRFLSGNPANMRRLGQANTPRVLSLSVDGALSASVSAADMEAHAASAAAIIDTLEAADYRVELFWVWRANGDSLRTEVAACVKQADQAVNLSTLAFSLGHPAMLRRIGFALVGSIPHWRGISTTMGVPCPLVADPERGAYVIPSAQTTKAGSDPIKAFDAQITALRKQGCPGLSDEPDAQAA